MAIFRQRLRRFASKSWAIIDRETVKRRKDEQNE